MSKTLTASEKATLLRYASSLPVGSETRRAVLVVLARPHRKTASDRMEVFEDLEAIARGIRHDRAWVQLVRGLAEADGLFGRGDSPRKDINAAMSAVQDAMLALDKAIAHLRAW